MAEQQWLLAWCLDHCKSTGCDAQVDGTISVIHPAHLEVGPATRRKK